MTEFKVGDKVVQIESSSWSDHDYPEDTYPELTVSKVDDSGNLMFIQSAMNGANGFSMSHRFRKLYTDEKAPNAKDTNPKDAIGIAKAPLSTVSAPVLSEVGVGMLEGALKYGRHNYRDAGVRASVYYDATMRHLFQWWEGEDIDPDSGLSHITKAICSLVVLRDAQINDMVNDDRPPKVEPGFIRDLEQMVKDLQAKYPNPAKAYTHAE